MRLAAPRCPVDCAQPSHEAAPRLRCPRSRPGRETEGGAPEVRASAGPSQPWEHLGLVKIPTYCASMSGHSGQFGDCGVGLLIGRARLIQSTADEGVSNFRNSDPADVFQATVITRAKASSRLWPP